MPQTIHVTSTPPTTQDAHAIHIARGADGRYSDVRMQIPSVVFGSTRRSRFMFDASARTNLARSSLSLPHHGVKREASASRVHGHADGTPREEQKAQHVVKQEHDAASSARLRDLENKLRLSGCV